MPAVRYGPDITDDAARTMNTLVDLQKKRRKAGGTLSKPDRARYNREKKLAQRLFGLKDSDIEKGKFGRMQRLARYSAEGKDKRGRRYKGAKLAKRRLKDGSRRVAGRSVRKESEIRSLGKSRRTLTTAGDAFGGASRLGRTTPKGLQKELAAFDRWQKRRGSISYGGRRVGKIRGQAAGGKEDLDRLFERAPNRATGKLVKKTSAASRRAKSTNRKRKAVVKKAGKAKRPTSARKKPRKR